MRNHWLPTWFLAAMLCSGFIRSSLGLKCYECMDEQNCSNGRCEDGDSCVKAQSGTVVSKGCLDRKASRMEVTMQCHNYTLWDEMATVCYCDHELCNRRDRLAYAAPLLVFFSAFLSSINR